MCGKAEDSLEGTNLCGSSGKHQGWVRSVRRLVESDRIGTCQCETSQIKERG